MLDNYFHVHLLHYLSRKVVPRYLISLVSLSFVKFGIWCTIYDCDIEQFDFFSFVNSFCLFKCGIFLKNLTTFLFCSFSSEIIFTSILFLLSEFSSTFITDLLCKAFYPSLVALRFVTIKPEGCVSIFNLLLMFLQLQPGTFIIYQRCAATSSYD